MQNYPFNLKDTGHGSTTPNDPTRSDATGLSTLPAPLLSATANDEVDDWRYVEGDPLHATRKMQLPFYGPSYRATRHAPTVTGITSDAITRLAKDIK